MEAEMDLLSHWVLDEEKVVPCSYLLRHTDLDVVQAQTLLEEFLRQNITNERISACYYLLGEISDDRNDEDGIQRKKSVVCEKSKLEETKKRFKSIDVCSIFSVQVVPLSNFQVLFNWCCQDSDAHLSPIKGKAMVENPTALHNYAEWKKSHQIDEQLLEEAKIKVAASDRAKNDAKQKENEKTAKKIGQLFAKSVKTATPEKVKENNSSEGSCTPSPFKKTAKKALRIEECDEEQTTTTAQKKLRGTFRLSSDDDEAGTSAPKTSSVKSPESTETNKDDIYCTDDGDAIDQKSAWNIENETKPVEEEGRKPGRKSKTAKEAKTKRPKPKLIGCDSDEEENTAVDEMDVDAQKTIFKSTANSNSPAKRQVKVTETFVDEDGFEVTRTVLRTVKDEDAMSIKGAVAAKTTTSSSVLKPTNSVNTGGANKSVAKKKNSTANVKKAQPKISSFFTRKAD